MKSVYMLWVICGAVILWMSISYLQHTKNPTEEMSIFSIQSLPSENMYIRCPESIEETLPDSFSEKWYIPTWAILHHTTRDQVTSTFSCHYAIPWTEQIIPWTLYIKTTHWYEDCIPNVEENTLECW